MFESKIESGQIKRTSFFQSRLYMWEELKCKQKRFGLIWKKGVLLTYGPDCFWKRMTGWDDGRGRISLRSWQPTNHPIGRSWMHSRQHWRTVSRGTKGEWRRQWERYYHSSTLDRSASTTTAGVPWHPPAPHAPLEVVPGPFSACSGDCRPNTIQIYALLYPICCLSPDSTPKQRKTTHELEMLHHSRATGSSSTEKGHLTNTLEHRTPNKVTQCNVWP